MKLIKLLAPLLISGLFAMPSNATQIENTISWSDLDNRSAVIKYSSDYEDEAKYFGAMISHSNTGEQRLYFFDVNLSKNLCAYESNLPTSTTMNFNGQAVKMSRWCVKKDKAENTYYFFYSPETDRGHTYVVNLFKTALLPIKIQYNNETLRFPVTGFTKSWNSAGGNAI